MEIYSKFWTANFRLDQKHSMIYILYALLIFWRKVMSMKRLSLITVAMLFAMGSLVAFADEEKKEWGANVIVQGEETETGTPGAIKLKDCGECAPGANQCTVQGESCHCSSGCCTCCNPDVGCLQ